MGCEEKWEKGFQAGGGCALRAEAPDRRETSGEGARGWIGNRHGEQSFVNTVFEFCTRIPVPPSTQVWCTPPVHQALLGAGDAMWDRTDKNLCPHRASIPVGSGGQQGNI